MNTNDQKAGANPPAGRYVRRLKIAGIVILILGLLSAGLVYQIGSRNDLSNDPSMLRFNQAQQQQMGQLYGSSGQMVDEWSDDLKQPGTQAILTIIISGLVSAGCFYFARLLDEDSKAPPA